MGLSLTHIILLLVVVLVVFGAGKLPQVMGDLGKGVRNFKAGLNNGDVDHKDAKFVKDDKAASDKPGEPPLPPPTV
ncbi:MAG: twin-arginine translocase TatA/TatE family subunit [Alphaproteobacteria bacterium]|nr:twin-arginine translocase TatA/TatE family subunit [Alphaproteobacteria bacterium]